VVKSYQTVREAGAVWEPTTQPAVVIQGAVLEPSSTQLAVVSQPPMESTIFNPPIATSPVVFCQLLPDDNEAPVTDLIEDFFNGENHDTRHDDIFGTSPQDGDPDTDNNTTAGAQEEDMEGYGVKIPAIETWKKPVTQELVEDKPVTQVLVKDPTIIKVEGESSSSLSDDCSFLDQDWGEQCNKIIALGDEINYYHFMVVTGTPGAIVYQEGHINRPR
jgi:hypothetical protein